MIAARSSLALVVLVFATSVLLICWNDHNSSELSMTQGKRQKHQQRLLLENDNSNSGLDLLRLQFQAAREQYIHQLHVDYGAENVENMFFTTTTKEEESGGQPQNRVQHTTTWSVGRTIYQSPSGPDGPSWHRIVRKVAKKILQSHLLLSKDKKKHTTFVWASGGHSAAAGHGNFFNESYTAVLGRNVRNMFAAVGLRFEARNMAMGGTPSGHEIASCVKEVFGADVVSKQACIVV
jgi:hypothetical protein